MLFGDSKDLAAGFEKGSLTAGGKGEILDVFESVLELGADFGEVKGHLDGNLFWCLAFEAEKVEFAGVFKDDGVGSDGRPFHIVFGELGDLAFFSGL